MAAESSVPGGAFVRYAYRLGKQAASGVLTISSVANRGEIFVLRRGAVVVADELGRRKVVARLQRLAAVSHMHVAFTGGLSAYPPGATHQVGLATWARAHLEQQLDGALAEALVRELAGARLAVRAELAPLADDEADRRMLDAMDRPRRLEQIATLARTPRFRLLAFVHFLRGVGALVLEGVVAERSGRMADAHAEARRVLGVDANADLETIKRAYHRLARALHPDLQPEADRDRRRALELRFAEVTAAYETLA